MARGADETLDSICGGAVRVLQRKDGYRFNLDPVLLAHFAADGGVRGPAIDLGTGSGVIALILARKFGVAPITGLELQPRLFDLAQRNVQLNGCEDRVAVALGDLRHVADTFPRGSFAHAVSNPPYRARDTGLLNPEEEKALARHELACRVEDLASSAGYLLREGGMAHVVFPAGRLSDLVLSLVRERLVPKRLRMVHARAHLPAQRVLLTAVKGGAGEVTVVPPLIVHPDPSPRFTPEVRQMLESPTGRTGSLRAAPREERPGEI